MNTQSLVPQSAGGALVPTSMGEAMKLAEMMAGAKLVPQGLQKSPADCLMVIQQAVRWQMDPFAVAQECSVIQGKLMHSGKLVAAVVNARGNLQERLSFAYDGEGDNRRITVSGRCQGETERRSITVRLGDVKTNNRVWQSQPDQQLMYHGCRVWARRHTPELMLGVWSPEEFDEPANGNGTPVIEHQAAEKPAKRTREQISAEAARKRQDLRDCEADINQMESLYALEKYEREVLTPEFMAALGMKSYALANTLENRRRELQAQEPQAEEAHDPDTGEIPERDHAFDQSLCDELIQRIEECTSAEDIHRLGNVESFKTSVARLPSSMQTTVRRYWKTRLEKVPADA